jgi:thioredoxin 1
MYTLPHPSENRCASYLLLRVRHQKYRSLTCRLYRFSEEFTEAHFIKVDVDEVPDVAQELGIRAMPTFIIFKGGEKVGEVVGANPPAVKAAIQKALGK